MHKMNKKVIKGGRKIKRYRMFKFDDLNSRFQHKQFYDSV